MINLMSRRAFIVVFGLCLISILSGMPQISSWNSELPPKHLLIEWSHTTPDSHLLALHYQYWEDYLPYDGLVLYVNHKDHKGIYGERHMYAYPENQWPLHALVFSGKPVNYDDFKHAVDDLKDIQFKKFTNNFILLSLYAGRPAGQAYNWWDDKLWETTLANAKVLARIAKESGTKGIWFDTEEYAGWSYFNYSKDKSVFTGQPQDFDSYKRLLRKRGMELMSAIGSEYPACEVVLSFGTTLVYTDVIFGKFGATRDNPSPSIRSLLPSLVDGMLFAAKKLGIVLTDGNEISYFFKEEAQFRFGRRATTHDASYLSEDPAAYTKAIKVGFGLYPNSDSPAAARHFTPKELGDSIFYALKYTDKYVWTWGEKKSLWVKPGEGAIMSILPHPSHVGVNQINPENVLKKGTSGIDNDYLNAIREGKRRYEEYYKALTTGQ